MTERSKAVRTLYEAMGAIEDRRPFTLRGLKGLRGAPDSFGYLPEEYHDRAAQADYVIYSYGTPIAWVTDGQPHCPDIGYSPTTAQHQYLTAHALGLAFQPRRNRTTVRIPPNASAYGRPLRARSGGVDGVRPGEHIHPGRRSAYAGMGDDAAHMDGSGSWDPYRPGYRHPAHP